MSDDAVAIVRARREAERARLRLGEDVHLLTERASPKRIASDAIADVKHRAVDASAGAVRTAQRRPLALAAGVAGLTLVLTRKPLRRAAAAIGAFAWRNRLAIGRLLASKKARAAAQDSTWKEPR